MRGNRLRVETALVQERSLVCKQGLSHHLNYLRLCKSELVEAELMLLNNTNACQCT